MKIYFIAVLFVFTLSCSKKEKNILLQTETSEHYLNECFLIIYDDSTYSESRLVETKNEIKNEPHFGKLRIKEDTLFFEDKIGFLKNGHVEVIIDSLQMKANSATESYKKELLKDYKFNEKNIIKNGKSSYRLKVEESKLEIPNFFDINRFNRYHQFYSHYYDFEDFQDFQDFKRINLSNEEMTTLDKVLSKSFKNEESLKKLKREDYYVQFIPIRTSKNEIYIIGLISCNEDEVKTTYISSMNDGGDCYIFFKLNLNTEKIDFRST